MIEAPVSGREWGPSERHPGQCLKGLVPEELITRSRTADASHLLEGAGLYERRTLVGTHRFTSFGQYSAPPSTVTDGLSSGLQSPTRRHTSQTRMAADLPESDGTAGQQGCAASSVLVRRFVLKRTSNRSKTKVCSNRIGRIIDLDRIKAHGMGGPLRRSPP